MNSGKEQFPKLLSRCHLPKNFTEARYGSIMLIFYRLSNSQDVSIVAQACVSVTRVVLVLSPFELATFGAAFLLFVVHRIGVLVCLLLPQRGRLVRGQQGAVLSR